MADLVGFLSVRYRSEHGFFGGYLIVNQLARPLEFHCTMPVRPSRSQELLYGKTLNLRSESGRTNLNYQGNWRDIFQNWEALASPSQALLPP